MLAGELGPVPTPEPAFAEVGVAEMTGMEWRRMQPAWRPTAV
jgi:hypothetical protein